MKKRIQEVQRRWPSLLFPVRWRWHPMQVPTQLRERYLLGYPRPPFLRMELWTRSTQSCPHPTPKGPAGTRTACTSTSKDQTTLDPHLVASRGRHLPDPRLPVEAGSTNDSWVYTSRGGRRHPYRRRLRCCEDVRLPVPRPRYLLGQRESSCSAGAGARSLWPTPAGVLPSTLGGWSCCITCSWRRRQR